MCNYNLIIESKREQKINYNRDSCTFVNTIIFVQSKAVINKLANIDANWKCILNRLKKNNIQFNIKLITTIKSINVIDLIILRFAKK